MAILITHVQNVEQTTTQVQAAALLVGHSFLPVLETFVQIVALSLHQDRLSVRPVEDRYQKTNVLDVAQKCQVQHSVPLVE